MPERLAPYYRAKKEVFPKRLLFS